MKYVVTFKSGNKIETDIPSLPAFLSSCADVVNANPLQKEHWWCDGTWVFVVEQIESIWPVDESRK